MKTYSNPPESQDDSPPLSYYDSNPPELVEPECTPEPPASEHSAEPWPEVKPFPPLHEPPEPFRLELLPEAFRPFVEDNARRLSCPPDFLAVPLMISAGAALGRALAIKPKRRDDWHEVGNLWGAIIAKPAAGKTPAISKATAALESIDSELARKNEEELKAWAKDCIYHEEQMKVARGELREAAKERQSNPGTAIPEPPEKPPERRLIVSGITPEKLLELNSFNPRGLLLKYDELSGLLHEMGKKNREGEREFLLTAATGKEPHRGDTLSRGRDFVPNACVSLVGGIQPGPLKENLLPSEGAAGDGLFQRFSLIIWPEGLPSFTYDDEEPNRQAKERAHQALARLWQINAEGGPTIGEPGEEGEPHFLRFSPEAQPAFIHWLESFMNRLNEHSLPEAMESHLSKYRKALPTLALLFEVLDNAAPRSVSLQSWQRAEAWGEYLESHLRKIYGANLRPEIVAARAIVERLPEVGSKFTARKVKQADWKGLTDPEAVEAGLSLLAELGWLRIERKAAGEKGGRPSELVTVNPAAIAKHSQ